MSIIDKAKSFMGGHGVTVRHVTIEGAEPAAASLALSDGGVRGQLAVIADKPCTILAHHTEMVLEIQHADGRPEQIVVGGQSVPEPEVERAAPIQYPYDLAAGFEITDDYDIVFDGSIEALLARRRLVVGRDIRFFLRTRVEVKGSPFDPEVVDELPLRP
jgi:hypothetical protein